MAHSFQVARSAHAGRATCVQAHQRERGLIRGEDITVDTVLDIAGTPAAVIGICSSFTVEIWLDGEDLFGAPSLTVGLDDHLPVFLPPEPRT